MGLFSRPKCLVHNLTYSIGTNGLTDYYYCKSCQKELRNKRLKEEKIQAEMKQMKEKITELESKIK